jgi:acyl carrier protein
LNRDALLDLIRNTVAEFTDGASPHSIDESMRLFGHDGLLDSIGLVGAIAEIELRVREQFGGSLVLADERAMSQTRSPFRTVGSLADYALQVHEQE